MGHEVTAKGDNLLQPGVSNKLRRLRTFLRARLAFEGLAWLLIALVAAVFVTLAFDYLLRLDNHLQRACAVAASLAVVAWVAWREMLAPLLVPMKAENLALLVENHYDQLGDRLIGAIQFGRTAPAHGTSRAMVAKMAAEADVIAQPLDFREVVERRRLKRMLTVSACAFFLLAGFSIWQHNLMGLWFQRNVLFADVAWPQKTYLEVLNGPDFAVLRGEDLRIRIAVAEGGSAPPHITLHRLYPSVGRPTEDKIVQVPGSTGRYVKVIRGINEPFEFYVTGGDDQTDKLKPHRVRVVDPPALREVVFTVEYPSYTAFEPRRFDGIREILIVPFGGRVRVDAVANKALASAEISLVGKDERKLWPVSPAAAGDAPLGTRNLTAQFDVPCKNVLASKTLKFRLKDMQGYNNRSGQIFSIQILPDVPPNVQLEKVGGLSELRYVTPRAKLPLRITVKDRYGIGLLKLTDRHDALVAAGQKRLGLSPEKIKKQCRLPAAKISVDDEKTVIFSEPVERLLANRTHISFRHLHKLSFAERVKPGQEIRIFATAEDTRTKKYKGPGTGQSKPLKFEVVDIQVMRDKLLAKQKRASDEFAGAIRLQSMAYAKSDTAATSKALKKGTITAALRAGLAGSARGQRAVGDICGETAAVFQGILEEMKYNSIGETNEYIAMDQGIIGPIKNLTDRCDRVAGELNGIVAEIGEKPKVKDEELPDRIAEVAAEQQAILEEMKIINRRMEKLRSLQAMANKVQGMIRWLEQLHAEIEKQREAGLEGVFEP